MALWDRDYARSRPQERGPLGGIELPPTGALTLFIIHGLAWATMLGAAFDAVQMPLRQLLLTSQPLAQPLAILLHPLADGGLGALLTLVVIWTLGGRLERTVGTRQLVRLYLLGNLLAGAAYYALAALLRYEWTPLSYPVGALAAWVLAAWRHMRYDMVVVFGRLIAFGKAAAIAAAAIAALRILFGGPTATGWLIAVLAGLPAALLAERLPVIRFAPRSNAPRPRRSKRSAAPPSPGDDNIDSILEKISSQGIGSLNKDERARLEKARQARLRR